MQTRPDILVLGGGGRAADAWLTGVLAGIEDASGFELSSCDYFVGTSAGSVVAARLSAGQPLSRPVLDDADAPAPQLAPEPSALTDWALALAGPFASLGLRIGTPPAAAARALGLRLLPHGRAPIGPLLADESPSSASRVADESVAGGVGAAAATPWDGRLRIVAVARRSGRRVVFGSPGAPDASVGQAVRASCSVPLMFGPAVIDGVEYVDGGVWSLTNADVAPAARGAHVLLLSPTASLHGPLNAAFRAASRAAQLVEASALTARRADVRSVAPDRDSAAAIGRALMSSARLPEILAAGYRQGLAL